MQASWDNLRTEVKHADQLIEGVRHLIYEVLTPAQRVTALLVANGSHSGHTQTSSKFSAQKHALTLGLLEDIHISNIAPSCTCAAWLGSDVTGERQSMLQAMTATDSQERAVMGIVLQYEETENSTRRASNKLLSELREQLWSEFRATIKPVRIRIVKPIKKPKSKLLAVDSLVKLRRQLAGS